MTASTGVHLSVAPPDGFEAWSEAEWDGWLVEHPWEPAELLADRGHWLIFLYQARVHAPRAHRELSGFLERLMTERPIAGSELDRLRDGFDTLAREFAAVPASRLWTGTQFYSPDELHLLIAGAEEETGRRGPDLRVVDLWHQLLLKLEGVVERAIEAGRGVYFGHV